MMSNAKSTYSYSHLTDLVSLYKADLVPYEKISGYISLFIYDYPHCSYDWDEGKCDAFFEFIHPMIKTFTDRFTHQNGLFEDYLAGCLRPFMQIFDEKY